MNKMNRLFICSYGIYRSRTAANLYNGKYIGIKSRISKKQFNKLLLWADQIIVFEEDHTKFIRDNYNSQISKVTNLEIKDIYGKVDHPDLVRRIQEQMKKKNLV